VGIVVVGKVTGINSRDKDLVVVCCFGRAAVAKGGVICGLLAGFVRVGLGSWRNYFGTHRWRCHVVEVDLEDLAVVLAEEGVVELVIMGFEVEETFLG